MLLFIMRHGVAEDAATWPGDDASRPLTQDGQKKTRQAGRGLQACVKHLDLIATSPLLRARQTAEIAREIFKDTPLATWPELEAAEFSALARRLQNTQSGTVMLVGHEPGLSTFVSRLLTQNQNGFALDFKKAGVCALEVEWSTFAPRATLLWLCTPSQLQLMREKT